MVLTFVAKEVSNPIDPFHESFRKQCEISVMVSLTEIRSTKPQASIHHAIDESNLFSCHNDITFRAANDSEEFLLLFFRYLILGK